MWRRKLPSRNQKYRVRRRKPGRQTGGTPEIACVRYGSLQAEIKNVVCGVESLSAKLSDRQAKTVCGVENLQAEIKNIVCGLESLSAKLNVRASQ
jgi:hypothetical protein